MKQLSQGGISVRFNQPGFVGTADSKMTEWSFAVASSACLIKRLENILDLHRILFCVNSSTEYVYVSEVIV